MSMSVEPHNNQEVPVEEELERRQWKPLLRKALLIIFILWIVHVMCIGLAVWHVKRAVEAQDLTIEQLSIDATAQDSIEIRTKAGFKPSPWFYSFFLNIYKPISAKMSFPGLGLPEDVVTVTVPAFKFGHEQTMLDFVNSPIQVKLLDRVALEEALLILAKQTNNLSMLHEYHLKAKLKLDISFFTMTFWLPIWLDRTLTIPINIPIKPPIKKKSHTNTKKLEVVEPQKVEIMDQDGNLVVNIQLRVNYDALPIPMPIELCLPEIVVDLGIASHEILSVEIPQQSVNRQSPHIRLKASLMKKNTEHIARFVTQLAKLDWSAPVFITASRTRQECMVQQFMGQSISLQLPFQQLVQMGLNGQAFIKTHRQSLALNAHKLVDLAIDSVEGSGGNFALIKASAVVTPPKNPPLHAVTNLPQLGVVVAASNEKELAKVKVSAHTSQSSLHVATQIDIFDMSAILRALVAANAGFAVQELPDVFKDQVSLQLKASHPTLQALFDELIIDIGMGKIVLRSAPDVNLLDIPGKVLKNPPVALSAKRKAAKVVDLPVKHALSVSHVHNQNEFKLLADLNLQGQRVDTGPYISVGWPSVNVVISNDYQDIISLALSSGKLNVDIDNFGPILTKFSGTPIHAELSLASPVEKSGAALGKLAENLLNNQPSGAKIAVSAASTGKTMFTQFIPIPPPNKKTTPTTTTTKGGNAMKGLSAIFGISSISSDGLIATFGLEDLHCPTQSSNSYLLSFNVELPKLAAGVAINRGSSLIEAGLPKLCIKGELRNDQLCNIQVETIEQISQSPINYTASAAAMVPMFAQITADPVQLIDSLTEEPIQSIAIKGADDLCLARFINSMNLNMPVKQNKQVEDGEDDQPTEKAINSLQSSNPLDISLDLQTEQNTLDMSVVIRLPTDFSSCDHSKHTPPTLNIKQGAITLFVGLGDTESLEITLSRVLIPIKLCPNVSTGSPSPHSSQVQVNIRGRCGAVDCNSSSLHAALSRLVDGRLQQSVQIMASVSPFESNDSDLVKVGSISSETLSKLFNKFAERFKDLRQMSLNKATSDGHKKEVDGGESTTPDWLDLHVNVGSIPGSTIGRLPCPFSLFCPPSLNSLDGSFRVTVAAPNLLFGLLEGIDLNPIFKAINIPTPSGIKLTVKTSSEIGVKVNANDDIDLAAVTINPFVMSNNPEDCTDLTIDLFMNGGTVELHRLLHPILSLVNPVAPPVPMIDGKQLSHLPVSLQLKNYSDNLLSSVVAGAMFEVSLGNIFGLTKTNNEGKGTAKENLVKLDMKVEDEQAEIVVQGIEPIVVPKGIHVELGLIEARILRDRRSIARFNMNMNLQPGSNLLEPKIVLESGEHLGKLIGDILSENHMELMIQVNVGSAIVELPISYQQDQQFLVSLVDKVMDNIRSKATFVDQTTSTTDPNAPDVFSTHLIPDLPVTIDSALLLVRRALRSIYKCLNERNAMFRLKSKLLLKQSFLPPIIGGIQAGLVGVRLGLRLDDSSFYYDTPEELGRVGKDNVLIVGPAKCVPEYDDDKVDNLEYLQCARKSPLKIIGQKDALFKKSRRRRPRGMISKINRALQKIVKTATSTAGLLGVSRPLIQNFSSLMDLVVGGEANGDDPLDGSSVALALTFADARRLMDKAMNEGGMCMELPAENNGFAEVNLIGTDKTFNLHIPLNGFAIPVPTSSFSDPCNGRPQCRLENKTIVESENVRLDPLGSWSAQFSFSQKHPRTSVKIYPIAIDDPSETQRRHHLTVNFVPQYVAMESNALNFFRQVPYLSKLEHFFDSIAQLADRFGNDQAGQEKILGFGNHMNAITLELNGAVLYHKTQPAIRINGVFPPFTNNVQVRLDYCQALKKLVVECWDGDVDLNGALKVFQSVFPVDIGGALQVKQGDWLSIGVDSGSEKKMMLNLAIGAPRLDQAQIFGVDQVIPGRSSAIVLQLWDECSRPLTLMHSRVQVRLRNGLSVIQGDATLVDGMFKFEFVAPLPGTYQVSLRMNENDQWTTIKDKSVYVRQHW